MFTIVPRRYNTPKWQARVPDSQGFVFKDGTKIRSLFELKQALMTLPEETVIYHLDPNRHDIANWILGAVNDEDLSKQVAKQHHRWGLIVTLERGLMRTLNLPPYVAARWLAPASVPFHFQSGEIVSSITELKVVLNQVTDTTIQFHTSRVPNDISLWVLDAIGDYELADMLEEASNRLHMLHLVEDREVMLKEASSQ